VAALVVVAAAVAALVVVAAALSCLTCCALPAVLEVAMDRGCHLSVVWAVVSSR
jgi:hypothetical protein